MKRNLSSLFFLRHLFVILVATAVFFIQGPSFVSHLSDHLIEGGDSFINSWILAWNAHALATPDVSIWDAPIFHPAKTSLAFSETMFGNLWLTLPIQYLTDNSILAANSLLFVSFVLGMYCVFLLVYDVTKDYGSGIIAGLVFSFNPYRWSHGGHLQLLPIFWSALALLFANRFFKTNQKKPFFLMLACIWIQYYTSVYLGTMLLTLIFFLFIVHIFGERDKSNRWLYFTSRGMLGMFAVGGVISILVLLPLGVPYLKTADIWGAVRSLDDNAGNSSEIFSFFVSPGWAFANYRTFASYFSGTVRSGEGAVFLGVTPWLLIGYSLITYKRRKNLYPADQLVILRRYIWAAMFMAILTLGPYLIFLNHTTKFPLPYQLFYYTIPGAKAIRVPARFAQFFLLCMMVAGGVAIAFLSNRWKAWARPIRLSMIAAFALLLYWDYMVTDTKGVPAEMKNEFPPVYQYLAETNTAAPILEIPVGHPGPAWHAFRYLHYQTLHWQPTLGGMSGYYPPGRYYLSNYLDKSPSESALQFLCLTPAKTILIHLDLYPETDGKLWEAADLSPYGFNFVKKFENTLVWERRMIPDNVSTKLNIERISYRLKKNKCYINLFLQPEAPKKGWRYLKKGWSDIFIKITYADREAKTFQEKMMVPPYILPGETATVRLPKIKIPHIDEATGMDISSPILADYHVDMTLPSQEFIWKTQEGKIVGIGNPETKQLVITNSDSDALLNFRIIKVGERHIALLASNGNYVCAEGGGGREMTASREYIDIWEMFETIPLPDGKHAMITHDGHYVSSRKGILMADGLTIGPSETFYLEIISKD